MISFLFEYHIQCHVERPRSWNGIAVYPLRAIAGAITADLRIRTGKMRRVNEQVSARDRQAGGGERPFSQQRGGEFITNRGCTQFQVGTVLYGCFVNGIQTLVIVFRMNQLGIGLVRTGYYSFYDQVLTVLRHFGRAVEETVALVGIEDITAFPIVKEEAESKIFIVERVIHACQEVRL